jgi:HPt (histidine-containing phosphotransfer) domain-containing protein
MNNLCDVLLVTVSSSIAGDVIDLAHLEQMTLGDPVLERQVLELFERQAELLLARMPQSEPPAVASLAHTLCGSARAIGAWRVAAAAEALERAAVERSPLTTRLAGLVAAATEARQAIGARFPTTAGHADSKE